MPGLVPGIDEFPARIKDVDGLNEPGHAEGCCIKQKSSWQPEHGAKYYRE
jgi:hypothetical protein